MSQSGRVISLEVRSEMLLNEMRHGLRILTRSPGFAGLAVLTLALGIGASTAIFSVVEAVLLRALPYPNPQQIVRVWEQAPDGHRMSLSDRNFDDLRDQNRTFANLAAYTSVLSPVSGGREPVRANVTEVTRGFFDTLGIKPVRGRVFAPEEQRLHGTPAAVVSFGYWQRYLGGEPDLSKFHLRVEEELYSVVGVMPQGFDFPPGSALWIARELYPELPSRTAHNWRGLGRVRDGISVAQARANLDAVARRMHDRYGKDVDLAGAAVVPLADAMAGDVRTALLTLLGAVALLLLIACANVAGLLLARNSARRKELAVRAAFALTIGILTSLAISRILSSLLFGVSATDPITFAAVALLLAMSALLASCVPARRAMSFDPNEALRYE